MKHVGLMWTKGKWAGGRKVPAGREETEKKIWHCLQDLQHKNIRKQSNVPTGAQHNTLHSK